MVEKGAVGGAKIAQLIAEGPQMTATGFPVFQSVARDGWSVGIFDLPADHSQIMLSRKDRREIARIEVWIKAIVFGLLGLALLVGGLQHFAETLIFLVFMLLVVAVAGLGLYLVIKSGLSPERKLGIMLVVVAGGRMGSGGPLQAYCLPPRAPR